MHAVDTRVGQHAAWPVDAPHAAGGVIQMFSRRMYRVDGPEAGARAPPPPTAAAAPRPSSSSPSSSSPRSSNNTAAPRPRPPGGKRKEWGWLRHKKIRGLGSNQEMRGDPLTIYSSRLLTLTSETAARDRAKKRGSSRRRWLGLAWLGTLTSYCLHNSAAPTNHITPDPSEERKQQTIPHSETPLPPRPVRNLTYIQPEKRG